MRFQNANRPLRIEFFKRLRTSLLRFACSSWRTELKARKRRGCCGETDCSGLPEFFHVRNARADKLPHGNWLTISDYPQACEARQRVAGISLPRGAIVTVDVSVVIPTRRRPDLVRRAMMSALMQEGVEVEVVVVPDAEGDATKASVAAIGDRRVRLVGVASSVGGSEARNIGARAATGRYIALLDDDDEWLPGKLAKQVALAKGCGSENYVVTTEYLHRVENRGDEVCLLYTSDAADDLLC